MVINAVGHLAEAAWHHPDITASYAFVEVRLQNHAAKGITDKDFELAKKIEDVISVAAGQGRRRTRGHAGKRSALRLYQIRRLIGHHQIDGNRMPNAPYAMGIRDMEHAWIAGKAAALDAAVAEAAKLLAASRHPLDRGPWHRCRRRARRARAGATNRRGHRPHGFGALCCAISTSMRTAGLMLTTPGEAQLACRHAAAGRSGSRRSVAGTAAKAVRKNAAGTNSNAGCRASHLLADARARFRDACGRRNKFDDDRQRAARFADRSSPRCGRASPIGRRARRASPRNARRACRQAQIGTLRRRRLVGRVARCAHDRNVVRSRQRPERDDPLLRPAARPRRQRDGRAADLRLDRPDFRRAPDSAAALPSMIPGCSTAAVWSRAARPIASLWISAYRAQAPAGARRRRRSR